MAAYLIFDIFSSASPQIESKLIFKLGRDTFKWLNLWHKIFFATLTAFVCRANSLQVIEYGFDA